MARKKEGTRCLRPIPFHLIKNMEIIIATIFAFLLGISGYVIVSLAEVLAIIKTSFNEEEKFSSNKGPV